jgi:hypothetical protein
VDLIKIVPFRKKMIRNCDGCGRNPDWNGMSLDGDEVGFQPEYMVPRFLTIRPSDDPK